MSIRFINPQIPKKIFPYIKTHNAKEFIKKARSVIIREYQIYKYNLDYKKYLELQEKQIKYTARYKFSPKISILLPTYNSEIKYLKDCIDSVINQEYQNWELCIADDCSTIPEVRNTIKNYTEIDKRIKCILRKQNGHISKSTNSALSLATGQYIGLLDHDDLLYPNTLSECVKSINKKHNIDFIYTDEDKIDTHGNRFEPHFKPDWSPETLLSANYITHFALINKKLIDKVKGFKTGYEGAQDYDLFLRITELTKNIHHIPKILYSWRTLKSSTASAESNAKSDYAYKNGIKAISAALKRRNITAVVSSGNGRGLYNVAIPNNFQYLKYTSASTKHLGIDIYNYILENKDKYILFLDDNCSLSSNNFQSAIGLFKIKKIKMLSLKTTDKNGLIYKTGFIINKNKNVIPAFQEMVEGGYFNFNYSRMLKNFSAVSLLGTIIDASFFSKLNLKPLKKLKNYSEIGIYLSYLTYKHQQRIALDPNNVVIYKQKYLIESISPQIIKISQKIISKNEYDPNYNPNLTKTKSDFSIDS